MDHPTLADAIQLRLRVGNDDGSVRLPGLDTSRVIVAFFDMDQDDTRLPAISGRFG